MSRVVGPLVQITRFDLKMIKESGLRWTGVFTGLPLHTSPGDDEENCVYILKRWAFKDLLVYWLIG